MGSILLRGLRYTAVAFVIVMLSISVSQAGKFCGKAGELRENAQKLREAAAECMQNVAQGRMSSCIVEITFRNNEEVLPSEAQALAAELQKEADNISCDTYTITAKSWIDASSITDPGPRAFALKRFANSEPIDDSSGVRDDYKIYQSFTVEVEHGNGKVYSAGVVDNSALSGSTAFLSGEVRMTDMRMRYATDRTTVSFLRTIEANPNWFVMLGDAFTNSKLRPIHNTIELIVDSEGIPTGKGSGSLFPSHRFWLNGTLFQRTRQVQPSAFFK